MQESYTLQQIPAVEGYYRFYIHIWSPLAPAGTGAANRFLLAEKTRDAFLLSVEPKGFSYSHNLVTLIWPTSGCCTASPVAAALC